VGNDGPWEPPAVEEAGNPSVGKAITAMPIEMAAA
jgi:hypothetical protein